LRKEIAMSPDAHNVLPGLRPETSPSLAPPPRVPVELIQPLTLADGRRVLVRPILPQDSDGEQAFVMGLSPASRYRRFHVGLHQLPPDTLRRLTEIDHRSHVALVAQPVSDHDDADAADDEPQIVADARYVRLDGDAAEFAVAVDDRWQGRGLGRLMLRKLGRHAARHGIRELRGDVLADNVPMIGLLRSLGAKLQPSREVRGMLRVLIAV
jgi:acetyltransferase